MSPTPAASVLHYHTQLLYRAAEGHGFAICGFILTLFPQNASFLVLFATAKGTG